jgi:hypothetical protein
MSAKPWLSTRRLVLEPAAVQDLAHLHVLWREFSVRRFLFNDQTHQPNAALAELLNRLGFTPLSAIRGPKHMLQTYRLERRHWRAAAAR